MVEIDHDVFSSILSHVSDTKSVHSLLAALPKAHRLFPVALARLWELPVYLDCSDSQASAASHKVLDYLLAGGIDPLAASIRQLVVSVEHESDSSLAKSLHGQLPKLFRRLVNLESLDYHSCPGIGMEREHAEALQHLQRMRAFAVDCTLAYGPVIPSAGGDYAEPEALSVRYDVKNWEMRPFLSMVCPKITSLELRQVNLTMFKTLRRWTKIFAECRALQHLKIDITEGVWDWGGGGSPAMGASPAFTFPFLGFPSIKRFELVVCDKTLSGAKKGPLDLVHCHLLTELSVDIRESLGYTNYSPIRLFEALSPSDFPVLSRLEIKDNNSNTHRYYFDPDENDQNAWRFEEREYPGLVPSFLGSMRDGSLPKLDSLWVDEKVLMPADTSLPDLLQVEPLNNVVWREALGAAFERLKSLRIGFGAITHLDVGLILGLCDPTKLTQFGFEWKWTAYGRSQPISTRLLDHLSRYPNLTDVHILFPRPGTRLPGTPDPVVDPQTLADVASIFQCNASICRVGIGNSVVWERHPSEGLRAILLVNDGSIAFNPAVPKFYHAGFTVLLRPSVQ
ncbi:hypothetical protein K438DRAFT_1807206 [Mycena galopus ATCC 62051]|nr:hypothetical protein K438DRAFT_1807206 [Mycena galopus ATCC 62051]